jgi:predicted O-linked N-acetylglucosamine transferase (SPINDLY family)
LTGLGERGLIADSPERFIETVAAMVESPAVLNETRARLTRVLGQCRLTDPSWFVPDIESALASMART